jgi:hypothetical protein
MVKTSLKVIPTIRVFNLENGLWDLSNFFQHFSKMLLLPVDFQIELAKGG